MDLISVIIPTYNRAECIVDAIDSVLGQTYKDYEIIVVDDGSTDDTRQVLEPYMDRIRYIYQENAGCAAARNTGIRESRGQWIAFLDSDDRWHPKKLKFQKECLERFSAKACFTNAYLDSEGGKESPNEPLNSLGVKDDGKLINNPLELVMTQNEFHTPLQSLLIDKALLYRIGSFDERFWWGTDMRFLVRVAMEGPFAYINRKLVMIDRIRGRKRLTESRDMYSKVGRGHRIMTSLIYAEVYICCLGEDRKFMKEVRRMLGTKLSFLAVTCCREDRNFDARRFALDGMYFGRGWRIYARCFAVLLCPWFVRRINRATRNSNISNANT